MASEYVHVDFQLSGCRELQEAHPESWRIREEAEMLEEATRDRPGVVVSSCRTIILRAGRARPADQVLKHCIGEVHIAEVDTSLEKIK